MNKQAENPSMEKPWTRYAVAVAGLALVGAIGLFSWESGVRLLALLAIPLVLNLLPGWRWSLGVGLVYFGVANAELPGIIDRFFADAGPATRLLAPAALTVLQALPFGLYRSDRSPLERAVRMSLVLVALTLPPVGWLAWRNPLLLAGLLYPGLGWVGLIGMLGVYASLAGGGPSLARGRRLVAAIGVASIALSIGALAWRAQHPVREIPGFVSFDTQLPPPDRRDPLKPREKVPGAVLAEPALLSINADTDVIVFPESVFDPMTPADQIGFIPATWKAQQAGVVILAGVTVPLEAGRWRNTVQAFGATEGVVDESRLPMPMGNWRPGLGGVAARPFASDVIELPTRHGRVPVAMSLCFEDTVLWPHRGLLTGQARVMVSLVNAWATQGSRGDRTQTLSATLLARLGGVPLVRARNTWESARQ